MEWRRATGGLSKSTSTSGGMAVAVVGDGGLGDGRLFSILRLRRYSPLTVLVMYERGETTSMTSPSCSRSVIYTWSPACSGGNSRAQWCSSCWRRCLALDACSCCWRCSKPGHSGCSCWVLIGRVVRIRRPYSNWAGEYRWLAAERDRLGGLPGGLALSSGVSWLFVLLVQPLHYSLDDEVSLCNARNCTHLQRAEIQCSLHMIYMLK